MMRALLVLVLLGSAACAQDIPARKGPGSYGAVGGTVSGVNSDYGQRALDGASLYVDANAYKRVGIEAQARTLRLHSDDGMRIATYLVGPRFSRDFGSLRVYSKILAGRGRFEFPYNYARGEYFVVAGGFGVDWRVKESRLIVRVFDLEFQRWPQFTFGELRPYGISSGLSLRVF